MCLSISICLPTCLFVCLFVRLSSSLSVCPPVCLSVCLSACLVLSVCRLITVYPTGFLFTLFPPPFQTFGLCFTFLCFLFAASLQFTRYSICYLACRRGTYKEHPDPDECKACPVHSSTSGTGSIARSDCRCNEGYEGNPARKIPCQRK